MSQRGVGPDGHGVGPGRRVVLGRRTPLGMVKFQWLGEEPEGLSDVDLALNMGAEWEGDELVTYNLELFNYNYGRWDQQFMEDSD